MLPLPLTALTPRPPLPASLGRGGACRCFILPLEEAEFSRSLPLSPSEAGRGGRG